MSNNSDNREAVTAQSPGLPGFGGYPGKRTAKRTNPNGVAPDLTPHKQPRSRKADATSSRLEIVFIYSQGSRQSPATLGSGAQPLCG